MGSDPGGEEQKPHKEYQDSDLESARAAHPGGVPASNIFAQ
ncbi:hypothetical protein PC129_g17111 [Phytophthora cactorum]|uniref:Uncharacterized protein n=1 Tax=Phytophthora cactorum TaxID=29920 RepID=A0A329S3M4_9STRA|nr:hypothetical protein Pcac1_g6869 [Phytophthora cactorum]KAG2804473.1 hypothetical protein PC112_g18703 [Phytophthora cactorum]KAG2805896.1 hypothetical protein PC111_g17615 [Phytophthora cactorum]KAG2851585.1 hypothetical protein PC113_g15786 [Phytophthora cactorum]KAG2884069.1 hypothetical protein PC114_g20298 [Phytophthora cactorum]